MPAGATSISSRSPCPTSPIQRSPVARSKRMRHGLRRPVSQISWRAPLGRRTGCRPGSRRRLDVRRPGVDVDAQDLGEQRVEVPARSERVAAARRRRRSRCTGSPPARRPARRRCGCRTGRPCGADLLVLRGRRSGSSGFVSYEATTCSRRGPCSRRRTGRRPGRDGTRAEQALLATGRDQPADVEERRLDELAVADDPDAPTCSTTNRSRGRRVARRCRPARRGRRGPGSRARAARASAASRGCRRRAVGAASAARDPAARGRRGGRRDRWGRRRRRAGGDEMAATSSAEERRIGMAEC